MTTLAGGVACTPSPINFKMVYRHPNHLYLAAAYHPQLSRLSLAHNRFAAVTDTVAAAVAAVGIAAAAAAAVAAAVGIAAEAGLIPAALARARFHAAAVAFAEIQPQS